MSESNLILILQVILEALFYFCYSRHSALPTTFYFTSDPKNWFLKPTNVNKSTLVDLDVDLG